MKTLATVLLALILAVPTMLSASDLQQPQSTLYPYQNSIELQDEFSSGAMGSGTTGLLGWQFTGGTVAALASVANRIGLITRDTSAVANTLARMFMSGTNSQIDPSLPHSTLQIIRLNNNDGTTAFRVGVGNSFSSDPPVDGIYIEKLLADTNWFCVTRAASVQTRTDSTVAVTTVFNTFGYTRNSSGVQFSINNVNVCGLITTNIPTAFLNPGNFITNNVAASKTFDMDYFQIRIFGIVR